jgi:hypothetical protein
MQRRRIDRLGRMAIQTAYWCQHAEAAGIPFLFASRHGDVACSVELLESLSRQETLSPTSFGLSVHNAIAALYSIVRGERGNYLALAAGLIQERKLGQGSWTDLLSIGLAATDFVGHGYGIGGQEMCLQLFSLDRDLGDFFRMLDRSGIDYAVALTADHGGQDVPERLRLNGIAGAARVDPALAAKEVGKQVAAKLKLSGPVLRGDFFGDIYIDSTVKAGNRARVLREAVAVYSAHPQVETVFTAEQLARASMPSGSPDRWTLLERARASFDPDRSGDFVVLLRQHITPIPDTTRYVATHGSPWDYDRRVPILFWRRAMPAANRNESIETVDIMPTLAAMLGVRVDPATVDGECLTGIQGVACPPR